MRVLAIGERGDFLIDLEDLPGGLAGLGIGVAVVGGAEEVGDAFDFVEGMGGGGEVSGGKAQVPVKVVDFAEGRVEGTSGGVRHRPGRWLRFW